MSNYILMQESIRDHLEFLYGEPIAQAALPRLEALMEKYAAMETGQRQMVEGLALNQRDVVLITYGDQVREENRMPLETLNQFLARHVHGLINTVHILPFYPYSSDDGFSVIDYYRVDPALGDWDNLISLRQNFRLMFDAVFNHVSAENDWFQAFLRDDPNFYEFFIAIEGDPDLSAVVRPRALPLLTTFQSTSGERKVWTTFSNDQVDLDVRNPEVLLALVDVLLFYVSKGAEFIRLDAIAYLWKEIGTSCIHLPQTHRIVQLMRAVLDEVAPGVLLITETNVPHVDNISYFGNGANEAQMVYNFALPPLVLDAFHTGNASVLSHWAETLVLPSRRVTFFNFLASHDGIGVNPARGILPPERIEALVKRAVAHGGYVSYKHNSDGSRSPYELNINYFDALSDPDDTAEPLEQKVNRFMAAQSIMLSFVGVPGIYFHSLFGSRNDREGAEQSGIARRINRQKFALSGLESELQNDQSLRAKVLRRFAALLKIRQSHPAFHPATGMQVHRAADQVFAVLRRTPDRKDTVLCLHNVSCAEVTVTLNLPTGGNGWKNLLDGRIFSGAANEGIPMKLAPYEVLWLAKTNSPES